MGLVRLITRLVHRFDQLLHAYFLRIITNRYRLVGHTSFHLTHPIYILQGTLDIHGAAIAGHPFNRDSRRLPISGRDQTRSSIPIADIGIQIQTEESHYCYSRQR